MLLGCSAHCRFIAPNGRFVLEHRAKARFVVDCSRVGGSSTQTSRAGHAAGVPSVDVEASDDVAEAPIDSFIASDPSTDASIDWNDGVIVIVEAMDEWIAGSIESIVATIQRNARPNRMDHRDDPFCHRDVCLIRRGDPLIQGVD